jgi:hypothetical protein
MMLGWAALMTKQLANIVVLNDARLVLPSTHLLPSWMPSELSLLTVLQVGIVLFGLLLALISLAHVNFRGTSLWTRFGRRTAPLVFVAYALGVLALLTL